MRILEISKLILEEKKYTILVNSISLTYVLRAKWVESMREVNSGFSVNIFRFF